jgi:hypothetical protein
VIQVNARWPGPVEYGAVLDAVGTYSEVVAMEEGVDAAARALVVLLITGCDATLSALAAAITTPQPAWMPVAVAESPPRQTIRGMPVLPPR